MVKEVPDPNVCPPWQVFKGHTLKVVEDPNKLMELHLKGSTASLDVTRSEKSHDLWKVTWKIQSYNGETSGFVFMEYETLARAFGLRDGLGVYGDLVAEKTSTPVDAAEQGIFVRWGQYLNIPHPGTGLEGDPNIAVEITPKIKAKIKAMLAFYEADLEEKMSA